MAGARTAVRASLVMPPSIRVGKVLQIHPSCSQIQTLDVQFDSEAERSRTGSTYLVLCTR